MRRLEAACLNQHVVKRISTQKKRHGNLKKKNFEDTSPFCGAIDAPVLDFLWHLPWVSKPYSCLALGGGVCVTHSLRLWNYNLLVSAKETICDEKGRVETKCSPDVSLVVWGAFRISFCFRFEHLNLKPLGLDFLMENLRKIYTVWQRLRQSSSSCQRRVATF